MPTRRNEQETLSREYPLTYRAAYDASNNVEYEGWSLLQSPSESSAIWLMCKHTYSSGNLTQTNWASMDFNQIWADRATLTFG